MAENIVRELEASAYILLAPPNVVTSKQRSEAERVFIDFQKTKSPFQLCRYIFETCKVDYVLFQAASLLKQAIVREWSLLDKNDIESLRTYLLDYITKNPSLQSYVREQLLLVVAIMVKRNSIDNDSNVLEQVLTDVSQLISSGDPSLQIVGCSILTALLNEYSSTTRASDVGLTWETHLHAKKKFETTDLKRIFQYCLQGLNELNKIPDPLPPYAVNLLKKFLAIAEQVLTWNFQFTMLLPRKLVGLFESQQCPTLRPGIEWKDTLLDSNVVQLFFKLHWQVRENPDLAHHTLQCLNQLGSLNGVLMNNKEARCLYLSWIVENLLKLLTSSTVLEHEILGLSNFISRLGVFFPPAIMTTLPAEMIQTYLVELTKLTCYAGKSAAIEEYAHKDDEIYMEAFEHLLDAWVTLLQDSQSFPQDIIKQSCIEIFNCFLQCHLSPPDGTRDIRATRNSEEIDETEDDDRTKFKDQLFIIGLLARQALEHCVPLLTRLLEDRLTQLHGHLQRIHQQTITINDSAILDCLNEDIHWLVMITGHLLAPVSEGETSLIPADITQYCKQEAANVNMETTLKVLASPGHRVTDIPGAEQATDPIIRLTSAVFRACEIEKRALEANLAHLLSPEVAITLVWFIRRWGTTYLLPNESYYTEMSMTLNSAFGRDSEAGMWTLNFLISKLESNLCLWSSEQKLAVETAQTLVALLNNTVRGNRAVSCENLGSILKKQSNHQFHSLPTAAKRLLLKSLVIVGTANRDGETRSHYWDELLQPLQERFRNIVGNSNFPQVYQLEHVKAEIVDLIECFAGVADGCTMQNLPQLFPFLSVVMDELVKLVGVYHNYGDIVGLIFQFFCTSAKRVLCFLNQENSRKLYECCLNMIQIYAKNNAGKLSRESTAEEEQYQDILILMQLLTDLLSKDFIDFSSSVSPPGVVVRVNSQSSVPQMLLIVPDKAPEENGEPAVSAADVALYGLNIIMPLMSTELLKFPSLCVQYFKLITFVCEIYPNKICQLPEGLFKNLIVSIELGLTSFTAEISSYCLNFLSVLGAHVHKAGMQATPVHEVLKPFLKLVLNMVLLQPLDADLTQTAGSTLFTLICCFQEHYQEVVQELIQTQTDPIYGRRLMDAFVALTADVQLILDRQNRVQFKDNFEKFVTEVRGFLCVK